MKPSNITWLKRFALACFVSVMAFVGAGVFAYVQSLREDKVFLQEALQQMHTRLNRAYNLDVRRNLGTRFWFEKPPLFIYQTFFVPWSSFEPFLPGNLALKDVKPILTGQFSSFFEGTSPAVLSITDQGITFPKTGEYGLYTTLGTFRILIQNPDASADERLFQIARFVARNTVHSNADITAGLNPDQRNTLVGKLFLSDQPLALWCAESSAVLATVLQQAGYKTRFLQLEGPHFGGHNVLEAYFPDQKSWGMLDVDYGVFLTDAKTGKILPLKQAIMQHKRRMGSIKLSYLAHKTPLQAQFNQPSYTPPLQKRQKTVAYPMTTPDQYLDMMQDLGRKVLVFGADKNFP